MNRFFLRRCKKNDLHYVVSLDQSFSELGDRNCAFCKSSFQDAILEIPEDGTPRIGFDGGEVKQALETSGLYFGRVEIIFSEK